MLSGRMWRNCEMNDRYEDLTRRIATERIAELEERVVELEAENARLRGLVAALEAEVERLRDALAKISLTSRRNDSPAHELAREMGNIAHTALDVLNILRSELVETRKEKK